MPAVDGLLEIRYRCHVVKAPGKPAAFKVGPMTYQRRRLRTRQPTRRSTKAPNPAAGAEANAGLTAATGLILQGSAYLHAHPAVSGLKGALTYRLDRDQKAVAGVSGWARDHGRQGP